MTPHKIKRKRACTGEDEAPAKRVHCDQNCAFLLEEPSPYKFNPVDEVWQHSVSAMLGLQFVRKNRVRLGGPNVPLTPDMCTVKHITGDGNCLFCSFAYIMTGSENQHMAVRTAILQHMINVGHFILGRHVLNYSSIQDYIADTNMGRESAWGTDIEMLTLSTLTTNSYSII